MSAPHLDTVLDALRAREPIFHRRELGTSRQALLDMTDDGFWEIGASGNVYDRACVISTLLERYKTPEPHDWTCEAFSIRRIADDLYQLNYILTQPDRRTRRTTLWRQDTSGWKIVFHQGTIIA